MAFNQSRLILRVFFAVVVVMEIFFQTAFAVTGEPGNCRPIVATNQYDIRIARFSHEGKVDVEQAERVHFSYMESAFRSGEVRRKPAVIWSELEYMVRRYPNHTGALSYLDRLSRLLNVEILPSSLNSVDCHFQRALRFTPDDMGVKMVYGIYLLKRNRVQEAIDMFKQVESQQPDNANNHYNLGLAYMAAKQPEDARQHAVKAYAQGFTLPGLKQKLKSSGMWGEVEEAAVTAMRDGAVSDKTGEQK